MSALVMLHIVVNGLVVFVLSAGLIELMLLLLRQVHPRLKLYLRLIPVIKLLAVLCFFQIDKWSFLQGIDPFLAPEGTRTLQAFAAWRVLGLEYPLSLGIEFTVGKTALFTAADVLAFFLHPYVVQCIILIVGVGSAFTLVKLYARWKGNLAFIDQVRKESQVIDCEQGATIAIHSNLSSPIAMKSAGRKWIVFPRKLFKSLSSKERLAVVSHEIEHLKWKDIYLNTALDLVASVFWWVPLRLWVRRLRKDQEQACDYGAVRTGRGVELASALLKAGRFKRSICQVAPLSTQKSETHRRVKKLISRVNKSRLRWGLAVLKAFAVFVVLAIALAVLFGPMGSL